MRVLGYLQLIRPINCAMAAFAVYIGSIVGGGSLSPQTIVLYGMVSAFLICAGGMALNDYFDVETDKINRPKRPLPSGAISKRAAIFVALDLFALGIALSLFISREGLIVAVAAAAILAAYACRLKKIALAGNLAVSSMVALTFIFGGVISGNPVNTVLLAMMAFLSNMGREIYKGIEDILGDRKDKVATIAVKYGAVKARIVANLFIISAIILSFLPLFLGSQKSVYFVFVTLADMIFLTSMFVSLKYSSKLCKSAMVIALVAFFVGAIKL